MKFVEKRSLVGKLNWDGGHQDKIKTLALELLVLLLIASDVFHVVVGVVVVLVVVVRVHELAVVNVVFLVLAAVAQVRTLILKRSWKFLNTAASIDFARIILLLHKCKFLLHKSLLLKSASTLCYLKFNNKIISFFIKSLSQTPWHLHCLLIQNLRKNSQSSIKRRVRKLACP